MATVADTLQLAAQYQLANRITEAEQLLKAALQAQPNSVKTWFSLGNLHLTQGQFSEAVAAYRQTLALQPDCAPIYNNLGYALQQQNQWEEAIASYQKALELQPNCLEADVNLGNALDAQGKLSKAQQIHYAALNNQLGNSRKQAGDLQTAAMYYRQATAMQPDLWEAHYNLGILLQERGELEDAIASYQTALKLNPNHWETYTRLGQIYQVQHKIVEAVAIYRQGLSQINPHYAKAVEAYQLTGMVEEVPVTPPIFQGEVTVGAYQFPAIPPVPNSENPRPFWTVVIPVYNRSDYLLECLASVLVQWLGKADMEILVVDNASTPPLFEFVNLIGGGIIRYYRNRQNLGAVRNSNAGIALSRGQWVHVLHDDDCVLPGFYARLQQSLEHCPDSVGVACTGFEYINEKGEVLQTGEVVSLYGDQQGIMPDWLSRIGICGLVTVPAMVVRRTTHEQLGGYYPELTEIADWELFKRLASFYDWWYEPGILARYREHTQKMTPDNWLSGKLAAAICRAIEVSDSYFPAQHGAEITAKARSHNFNYCLTRAAIPLKAGNLAGALSVIQAALKIDSSPQAVAMLFTWLTQDIAAPLREEIACQLILMPSE